MEMSDAIAYVWANLVVRAGGPLSFRFILQPAMAALLGIRDGIADARAGRSPYFWTVLSDPEKRAASLGEGIAATARVLLLGFAMDAIYQVWQLGTLNVIDAAIVALLLAFVPYLLIRGPAARIARWWLGRPPASGAHLRKQP